MKNLKTKLILLAIAFGVLSCTNDIDELISESGQNDNGEELLEINAKTGGRRLPDGTWINAGFGYNPATDEGEEFAFTKRSITDVTANGGSDADVKIIKTNTELEKFFSTTINIKPGFSFATFKLKSDFKGSLEKNIKFSRNSIYLIATLKIRQKKFETSGVPKFNAEAQQLIDQNEFSTFLKQYGTQYVDDQKLDLEKETEAAFLKVFNISLNRTLTKREKSLVERSSIRGFSRSTAPGYAPVLIRNIEEFNAESKRYNEFLRNNPEQNVMIDMKLKPYSSVIDNSVLRTEFDRQVECFKDLDAWNELRNEIVFIFDNTTSPSLRSASEAALRNINRNIDNSRNCINSVKPSNGLYNNIINEWNLEKELVPLYRYYSPVVIDHLYTADFSDLGNGGFTYIFEKEEARIYGKEVPNSLPLYRYYSAAAKDHFYTSNYNELGSGKHGYVPEGITGYVLKKPTEGHVPFHRYFNPRYGNHFYTVTKSAYHGYIYEGVVGYVKK